MARYYRRRYTRVVRPKKKWASNMLNLSDSQGSLGVPAYYREFNLVLNSPQATDSGVPITPTPVIIKTGNFKVQMDVSYAASVASPVDIRAYIMYIPEGVTYSTFSGVRDVIVRHPEWVMGWKYASIDFAAQNAQGGTETIHFSTRLKRNLNSGDKVALFLLAQATASNGMIGSINIGGICQFWTCAN